VGCEGSAPRGGKGERRCRVIWEPSESESSSGSDRWFPGVCGGGEAGAGAIMADAQAVQRSHQIYA
jgi:hypothetical protein